METEITMLQYLDDIAAIGIKRSLRETAQALMSTFDIPPIRAQEIVSRWCRERARIS